jgi:hypothetical protein
MATTMTPAQIKAVMDSFGAAAAAYQPIQTQQSQTLADQARLAGINGEVTSIDAKTGAPLDAKGNVLGTAADVKAIQAQHQATYEASKSKILGQLQQQAAAGKINWNPSDLDVLAGSLVRGGLTDFKNAGYNKAGQLIDTSTGSPVMLGANVSNAGAAPVNSTTSKGAAATDNFGYTPVKGGITQFTMQKDANGNPVFVPKFVSKQADGLVGFAMDVAPAVAGYFGGPLGAAIASGMSSTARTGDVLGGLKNAALGYAGGELGNLAGGATQGATAGMGLGSSANAALKAAASGATQTAVRGVGNGNFNLGDIALGGLAAGTSAGISNLLSPTQLPAGQAGPAAPSPYSTGVASLDKYLPGVIGRTTGAAISGQDIGTALTNNVIGAAGNYAGQQVGSALGGLTGSNTLDGLISSIGGNLTGQALTDYLHGILPPGATSPSKPVGTTLAQAAAPAVTSSLAGLLNPSAPSTSGAQPVQSAPSTTAVTPTTPAVNDQGNLLNYLALAGLAGSGSNQTTAPVAPQLANVNPMDLSWLTPTANKLYGNKVI